MSISGSPVGGPKGRLQQRSFDRGGEEIIERERWGAENVQGKTNRCDSQDEVMKDVDVVFLGASLILCHLHLTHFLFLAWKIIPLWKIVEVVDPTLLMNLIQYC